MNNTVSNDVYELESMLSGSVPLFVTLTDKSLQISEEGRYVKKLIDKLDTPQLICSTKGLSVEYVQNLYSQVIDKRFTHVVAIGGGTVMDAAKLIAIGLSNSIKNLNTVLESPGGYSNSLKLVFCPTTCGTGSEVTPFSVVYKNNVKYSIVHPTISPQQAILDYRFLKTLPDKVRNATLLDALAQAVEACWAKNRNEQSTAFATEAIGLLLKSIYSPLDDETLRLMHKGSYISGQSISIAMTTSAHAFSYPLTSYFGIDHGIAVFLVLPQIALINYDSDEKEVFCLLFDLFEVSDIESFKRKLEDIFCKLGFSRQLRDYGIKQTDIDLIADQAVLPGRSDNNPVNISKEMAKDILSEIF